MSFLEDRRQGGTHTRSRAPFAQCENVQGDNFPEPASFQLKKKRGSDVARVGGHGQGFDPAVYAANRASNAQTRLESRAKMSVGSGDILAHTQRSWQRTRKVRGPATRGTTERSRTSSRGGGAGS
ncbi:hypothetical protein WJX81_000805 [Elliptochloris bilobata]|uniref:Uncharacterized protein n=1 Tax=Elliptochloris bilobata TaxID=381761 RepID=A0AAW1RXU0_9CHLO